MAKKVLITWNGNWADEMDLQGYLITNKENAKAFKKGIKKAKYPLEISVGSNEEIEYNSADEVLDELSFKKITEEESIIIGKNLGAYFGTTNIFDYFE
jgi:hypothetical protein